MIDIIEYKGTWKLPESEKYYNGTLFYSPSDGAKLEIFGTFNSWIERSSKSIILGKTLNGDITLVDSWFMSSNSSNSSQVIIATYKPTFILKGIHMTDENDIAFTSVHFSAFNLFNWFDRKGISEKIQENFESYEISYKRIPSIAFLLTEKSSGIVSFESPINFRSANNEVLINEQAYITLNYTQKTPYKSILRDLNYLLDLFSLFTHEQSYPTHIVFEDSKFSNVLENAKIPIPINCTFQHHYYDAKLKSRKSYEHLVKYEDIKDIFPTIVRLWHEKHSQNESSFSLMLTYLRNKNRFSEDTFLNIVKAIEVYHRHNGSNERIPKEEYEKLVQKILESVSISKEDKKWLQSKLYGNEPNLKNRLEELIKEHQNKFIIKHIPDSKKFCFKVTQARNYYTHYDKMLQKQVINGKPLFDLTISLLGLIYSVVFKDIELENSKFEDGLLRLL